MRQPDTDGMHAGRAHQPTDGRPGHPWHILLVEDNPIDARLISAYLGDPARFAVVGATSVREALVRLQETAFDLVLLDLSLPDSSGEKTFPTLNDAAPDVPIVILTGTNDDALALSLAHAGAQDYLVKDHLDRHVLMRSIGYAIERRHLLHTLAMAQRQEVELKDRFLAHVSHELRSPLALAMLYATNMLDGLTGELTTEQREHLIVVVQGLRAQERLINDLLVAARSDASTIRLDRNPVSLRQLIADTINEFRSGALGVVIIDDTPEDLPPVNADALRIRQILANLIDNAVKFSSDGASIRIAATVPTDTPEFVQVDVIDSGPGLSPQAIERLFARQPDHGRLAIAPGQGVGLGLYICKLLVEQHGGRLWLARTGADGTHFSFTCPAVTPESARSYRPAKILIVDDDSGFRNGLGVRLRAERYATVFAADAAQAIAVARRESPDLVLLDVGLPGGDGFVVLQRLRALPALASIPVVVMTARPAEPYRTRALEAGAVAFLQKPLDNGELLATIRHWTLPHAA